MNDEKPVNLSEIIIELIHDVMDGEAKNLSHESMKKLARSARLTKQLEELRIMYERLYIREAHEPLRDILQEPESDE